MEPDGTTPVDLTGWTARAYVRRTSDDPEPLIALNVSIVGSHVYLWLTAVETGAMTSGGIWDLELVEPGGVVNTVLSGAVSLTKDVTWGP